MRSEVPETPLAVMAKPVGSRCNMRCAYCYYLDKGKYSENKKQTRMSFDLLEKLIRQTVAASPGPVVSFTWHGGEPTLAGLDFYRKALELEKKYLPKGWEAWNNLQTNGLLLNEGWCRFLKENRFDVGLSIDGSMEVHDLNRRLPNGAGTFERVSASIRRLRETGVEPDLLCTVNEVSQEKPLEVYRALRDTGCIWVQFIPVVIRDARGGAAPGSVTPEGYGRFLTAVFDEWVRHDLGVLDVQLFAEMARIMAGGQASLLRPLRRSGAPAGDPARGQPGPDGWGRIPARLRAWETGKADRRVSGVPLSPLLQRGLPQGPLRPQRGGAAGAVLAVPGAQGVFHPRPAGPGTGDGHERPGQNEPGDHGGAVKPGSRSIINVLRNREISQDV